MPTTVSVPQIGNLEFPDGMPEADMLSAIKSNFPQLFSQPAPSFGQQVKDAAVTTGKALVEPIRAIGQSMGYLGGITGALAKDVMAGNVLPSAHRGGLMPNFENVGAFMGGRPQPADEELTPTQQGVATGVKILPALGLATLGTMGGVPPSVSLPVLTGSQTFAETGSPVQAGLTALSMAPIGKLQTIGMEAASKVMSGAIKRFAESATGDVEEALARNLANSRVAQKAVETAVGNATVQAYLEALRLPEWLQASPEKKQEMLASSATQLAGFSLLQLPYFKGTTISQTQKLIAEDVPFVVTHIASSPEAVDFAVQEGMNPRNAQVFVEPRKNLPSTEGGQNAQTGQQQEGRVSEYQRVGEQLPSEGINRNVAPVEPTSRDTPGSGDIAAQGGKITPETVSPSVTSVAIVPETPPAVPVLAPSVEQHLQQLGVPRTAPVEVVTAAVQKLAANAQNVLDAGGTLPEQLAKELGVIEAPVAEPPPGKVEVLPPAKPQPVTQSARVPPPSPPKQTPSIAPPASIETPSVQSKPFDTKQAKEQKKYLLTEIDKAIAEAPTSPETGMARTPELISDRLRASTTYQGPPTGHDRLAWEVQKSEELADLFSKYGIPEQSPSSTPFLSMAGTTEQLAKPSLYSFSNRLTLLKEAIENANRSLAPKVTIEIPGDGTFVILDNRGALQEFKERAAKFPTTTPKLQMPTQASIKPSSISPLGDTSKENVIKAASAFISEDASRLALAHIWSDGAQTVATNGMALIQIDTGIGGSEKTPILADATGKNTKSELSYPNWKQIIPKEGKVIFKDLDTARLANLLRQAMAMTSDKSKAIILTRNADGSLAITSTTPELGEYGHNIREGGTFRVGLDPNYLLDAIAAARRIGQEKISIWGKDELSPIEVRAKGVKVIIMPMRLSAKAVPGATTLPLTLVDSQPLIDQALTTGGGSAALRAVVPQVQIRYGELPPGVPMQHQGGVVTISKPVVDFIATRWPQQAQAYIDKLVREELRHAVTREALTPQELAAVGQSLSSLDRKRLNRPEIADPEELGAEFIDFILDKRQHGTSPADSLPIDPNTPFGQRVLAALRKIWDYLTRVLRDFRAQFQGTNPVLEEALHRVKMTIDEVNNGMVTISQERSVPGEEPLNAKSIKEAIATFEQRKAEVGEAEALRTMRVAQAGEPVAANPLVQETVARTHALAQGPATTPEERLRRDVAARTLSEPIIRSQLAGPVEALAASVELSNGDLADFERVRRDPTATDDMVGAAAGNAVETLQALDSAVVDFKSSFDKRYEESKAAVKDLAESEMDAMETRDVAKELFQKFRQLGRLAVEQRADTETRNALQEAGRAGPSSQKVLDFLSKTQVLEGLKPDDNRSINDLVGYIHNYVIEHRKDYPKGTSYDSMVTENVGAGMDQIRDVLRIVRLSEPLLTEINAAKDLALGDEFKRPIHAIKTRMLDAIDKGHFNAAFEMFQKGLVEQGITLKQSRDQMNFFARKTRQALVNFKALENAGQIVSDLQADPALARQRREVYDWLHVRDIVVSTHGTTVRFEHAIPSEQTVDINWEGNTRDYEANLKKVQNLIGEYSAYIGTPDASGYDPGRAAGMRVALGYLDYFVDPAQHPTRGHLTPGAPANFIGWLGHFVGHPELVPKYSLSSMHNPLGDLLNTTGTAYSDVLERLPAIALDWRARRQNALKAAQTSHGEMREVKYRELIFDPLASSRQNYNDSGQLKSGDGIGNRYTITNEDITYLKVVTSMLNEMYSVVNNFGKHKFSAAGRIFAGILTDNEGKVRFPFSRGEDTVPRYFPEQLKTWIPAWENSDTEGKIGFLDANLTKLLRGYVDGVRRNDYKVPYTYRLQMKEVAREMGQAPLQGFDDLVQRITDKYNADSDNEPIEPDEVSTTILGEIGNAFGRAKERIEKSKDSNKSLIEIFGGDDEYNSPREQAIMPPGWYNYGVVTDADVSGSVRAGALPFANAHIRAARGFRDGLISSIQKFKEQARDFPNLDIKAQSAQEAREGKRRYSWQESEDMLEIISYYLTATEDEMKNSSSPWMKDRPYQMLSNPVANAIVTSLVAPIKPLVNNFMGGYSQMMGFNAVYRGMSGPAAFASTAKLGIRNTLKEVVYLLMGHPGNKVTRGIREMLENHEASAFIGNVAKWALDIIRDRQLQRDYSREIGTDLNQNVGERRRAAWKYWRTRGVVTEDMPSKARQYANLVGMLMEGYAQRLGHATVGYGDARLNGMGPDMVQMFVEDLKRNAIKYGDKRMPNGLYPDVALTGNKILGGEVNHAMRVRNGVRQSGITPSIDQTMGQYYEKVMAARIAEQQQGLPSGTLSNKVEMFSQDQINQMNMWIPEDVNMPTRRSRPVFWRVKDWIKKFGWLLQWGTSWLAKLNDLSSVVNNHSFLKRFGGRLPLMATIGVLVAVTATLSLTMRANFIARTLENKVTNFPTLLDATTPRQAAAAVIAATADAIPVYGDAYNMINGNGFKRGVDLNNSFLLMNIASDIMKTSKEIYQTGSIGRPLLQFASRYSFPLNTLGARLPAVSGLRDLTNARNILTMGAAGTGLETKLRKPGGGISEQNYTASTPLINDAVNAIGNGDQEGFQKAYNALVEQKRAGGSLNPQSAALTALKARNPVTSVFGTKPDPSELERVFANLPADLAERARNTINRFDAAISGLPRKTAGRGTKKATAGTARSARVGGFGLRRPKLRMPGLRLRKPTLRRLAA